MAETSLFWVRLELNATVKHFLVDMGGARFKMRTACGIATRSYFPYVEGIEPCPKCLEYTKDQEVKELCASFSVPPLVEYGLDPL